MCIKLAAVGQYGTATRCAKKWRSVVSFINISSVNPNLKDLSLLKTAHASAKLVGVRQYGTATNCTRNR